MGPKRLVIIDGYSLLFRAFYGTRYLSTSGGRPTNALFGFTNMMFALFTEIRPDAVLVALDAPGKTFRHAEFPEYKGTRRDTPQELIEQLEGSRELITAFRIPVLEVTGYEADDIVGTVSRIAEENGYQTTIVTGDLDTLQLVDGAVSVMTPQNFGAPPKTYTPEQVVERYGFGPEHVVDYKAMAGDSSDNIPGVPGVGEKTATELIKRFGHVEAIIERIEEVEPKYRKKIEPNIEKMKLSKWLATIDRDAPVTFDFTPYSLRPEDIEHVRTVLTTLEFKTQAKRLDLVLGPYVEGAEKPVFEEVTEEVGARLVGESLEYDALVKWVGRRPFSLFLASTSAQGSMFDDGAQEAFVAVGNDVRRSSKESGLRLFLTDPKRASGHDVKGLYRGSGALTPPPRSTR